MYDTKTIVQASDLKQELVDLNLQKSNVRIMSLDIVNFYPSIEFRLVRETVLFFV